MSGGGTDLGKQKWQYYDPEGQLLPYYFPAFTQFTTVRASNFRVFPEQGPQPSFAVRLSDLQAPSDYSTMLSKSLEKVEQATNEDFKREDTTPGRSEAELIRIVSMHHCELSAMNPNINDLETKVRPHPIIWTIPRSAYPMENLVQWYVQVSLGKIRLRCLLAKKISTHLALCNGSPSNELDPERKRARKGSLKLQRLAELAGRTSGAKAVLGLAKMR